MLFIHGTYSVYKLETFKKCKEVKHIMISIIAIIYIFSSYVVFHQQLKITFRKSSGPHWQNPLPHFYSISPKNSKSAGFPILTTSTIFQDLLQKGKKGRQNTRFHRSVLHKTKIDLLHFWDVYDVNLLENKYWQMYGLLMQNKCILVKIILVIELSFSLFYLPYLSSKMWELLLKYGCIK